MSLGSKSVYILEQKHSFCKYSLSVLRFASLRIAKKYLRARYDELMYTTQSEDPKINVAGERFLHGSITESCAFITTVRDEKQARYVWSITTNLDGVPAVEQSGNCVAKLSKFVSPIKMTEDKVDDICKRSKEVKNKVKKSK